MPILERYKNRKPKRMQTNHIKYGKWRKIIKNELLQRFGVDCYYCGIPFTKDECHVEHIIPKSKGGEDNLDNLRLVCSFCNYAKGDKDIFSYLNWLSHIRSPYFKCQIIKEFSDKVEVITFDRLQKSFMDTN